MGVNLSGALGNNSTDTILIPSSICNTVNSNEFTNNKTIKVFPNPSNNIIHVESESHIINLILFNNLGQVVKQKANSNYIDISEFENGTYFLKIEMRDRIFDTKNITILK
ncbi:MAG: T9SS type A sorting domain-containing protein [Saprospiraceae bacterium]|nr:T9SS type A sorting domain-containing protein [Saprospiraceae bacterium]